MVGNKLGIMRRNMEPSRELFQPKTSQLHCNESQDGSKWRENWTRRAKCSCSDLHQLGPTNTYMDHLLHGFLYFEFKPVRRYIKGKTQSLEVQNAPPWLLCQVNAQSASVLYRGEIDAQRRRPETPTALVGWFSLLACINYMFFHI